METPPRVVSLSVSTIVRRHLETMSPFVSVCLQFRHFGDRYCWPRALFRTPAHPRRQSIPIPSAAAICEHQPNCVFWGLDRVLSAWVAD